MKIDTRVTHMYMYQIRLKGLFELGNLRTNLEDTGQVMLFNGTPGMKAENGDAIKFYSIRNIILPVRSQHGYVIALFLQRRNQFGAQCFNPAYIGKKKWRPI
jgi:hypothetical protein